MDDICDSVHSDKQARKLATEIDEIFSNGGFNVKCWHPNWPLKKNDESVIEKTESELKLLQGPVEEKVLRTVWNHHNDVLGFKVSLPELVKLTKRAILSQIARIYDPLGAAAAFLIRAKRGMQKLWFFQEMNYLNNVTFERSLTSDTVIGMPVLCIFSDASIEAFGACAYIQWETETNTFVTRFIAAKSRVAPLESLTILRLELQAAVLAVRLCWFVLEESRMKFLNITFFSDSHVVLSWTRNQPRQFKLFVSARVAEIQIKSQWRHVPGEQNVADDVSRGIPALQLTGRWKNGPDLLKLPEEEWPNDTFFTSINKEVDQSERRKADPVFLVTQVSNVIPCKNISSWRILIRVTAYVFIFIRKNQRPIGRIPNDPDDGSFLCPSDILLGRASTMVPQGSFRETKNPRHRVEFVQKIVDSFWKRWSRDVFPTLVSRKKWITEKYVRVDDFDGSRYECSTWELDYGQNC